MPNRTSQTAAVILFLHCTGYYRQNDIADTQAYRKLIIIKKFWQHFIAICPKIVLHSLHNFVTCATQ